MLELVLRLFQDFEIEELIKMLRQFELDKGTFAKIAVTSFLGLGFVYIGYKSKTRNKMSYKYI